MSAGGGVVAVVCALVALLEPDCLGGGAPPSAGPPPPLSLPATYPCSPLVTPDQIDAGPRGVIDAITPDGHRLLVLRPALHGSGAVTVFYGTPTSMIERPLVNPFAASTTDAAFLVDGVEADVYFAGTPTLLIGDQRIALSVVPADGGTLAGDQPLTCVN